MDEVLTRQFEKDVEKRLTAIGIAPPKMGDSLIDVIDRLVAIIEVRHAEKDRIPNTED